MGSSDLRDALLAAYRDGQGEIASPAMYADIRSMWPYYEQNYSHLFSGLDQAWRIVEVGCGHGSLLGWLRSKGFENVSGVDASPGDVEFANKHLGEGVVVKEDALQFLGRHHAEFNVVILKALLEHLPKDQLLEFTQALSRAIRPGGLVVIDVPNMDWILASHERYMDLTHEGGFTKESLRSLLSLGFDQVDVIKSKPANMSWKVRIARPIVLRIVRAVLTVLGEGASDIQWDSRSIIAVARRPKLSGD